MSCVIEEYRFVVPRVVGSSPIIYPFLKSLFTVVKGLFLCPKGSFSIKKQVRQLITDALC